MQKKKKIIQPQFKKVTSNANNIKDSSFFYANNNYNLCILIAVLWTLVIYFHSIFNDFILNWDDGGYIVVNEVVKTLSWENIKIIFSSFDKGNYHPLTTLFYAVEYYFVGESPKLFHINNLIIHLLNVYLVYVLVHKLSKNTLTAFIVSLFFGIHPMHVESVAWISERKDVMYTFFFLLSVLSYYKYTFTKINEKKGWYLSLLYFFLALMSKSAAVPLPVVLLLIDYFKKRPLSYKLVLEKWAHFLLAFTFGIIAILSQDEAGAIQDLTPMFTVFERLMLASYALMAYIVKLFLPFDLAAMYPYPNRIGTNLPVVFYMAPFIVIIITALLLWSLKYTRYIVFGFMFYVVMIALVIQLLPVGGALMAERYTYVPYIGLFFIAAHAYSYIKDKKSMLFNAITTVFILFSLMFSYLTFERIKIWKDGEVLFTDVINKNPNLPFAYNNRGYLYYRFHENYEKAYADYSKSIEIDPTFEKAYSNRGVLLFNMNRFEEALADFNKCLSYNPHNLDALRGRANTLSTLKRFEEAIPDYNTYLEIKPNDELLVLWRGTAYNHTQQLDLAKADFELTLKINPENDEAYYGLGLIYYDWEDDIKAIEMFDKAINLKNSRGDYFSWRGLTHYKLKDYEKAIADFNKAIELNPQDGAAFINRSTAYYDLGNYPQAFSDLKAAGDMGFALDKDYFFKLFNLVEGKK